MRMSGRRRSVPQSLNLRARQLVGAFVVGVPGMALQPAPLDPVPLAGGIEPFPQVLILDRLLVGGAPAALAPAVDPLGDALAQVLAVSEQDHAHGAGERL